MPWQSRRARLGWAGLGWWHHAPFFSVDKLPTTPADTVNFCWAIFNCWKLEVSTWFSSSSCLVK